MFQSSGAEELWGFRCSELYPDNKLCINHYVAFYWPYPVVNINYRHTQFASLAPASSNKPMEEMRKDRSLCDAICAPWKAWNSTLEAKWWMVSHQAAPSIALQSDIGLCLSKTGLIQHPKMNKCRLAWLLLEVTLLAASTLAQMASMAALSSRRRAFFSFALLDFLWETRVMNDRIKTDKMTRSSHHLHMQIAPFYIILISFQDIHQNELKVVLLIYTMIITDYLQTEFFQQNHVIFCEN